MNQRSYLSMFLIADYILQGLGTFFFATYLLDQLDMHRNMFYLENPDSNFLP